MKISEAKNILAAMGQWHFFHMGIRKERPADMNYSLAEMLKANQLVERYDKRRMQQPGSHFISLKFDERGIAAMFTAMAYEGCQADAASSVTEANGKHVYVVEHYTTKEIEG